MYHKKDKIIEDITNALIKRNNKLGDFFLEQDVPMNEWAQLRQYLTLAKEIKELEPLTINRENNTTGSVKAYNSKGCQYLAKGLYSQAYKEFKRTISLESDYVVLYNYELSKIKKRWLGWIIFTENGEIDYKIIKFIALQYILMTKGWESIRSGDYLRADKHFTNISRLVNKFPELKERFEHEKEELVILGCRYYASAMLNWKMGNFDETEKYFNEAIEKFNEYGIEGFPIKHLLFLCNEIIPIDKRYREVFNANSLLLLEGYLSNLASILNKKTWVRLIVDTECRSTLLFSNKYKKRRAKDPIMVDIILRKKEEPLYAAVVKIRLILFLYETLNFKENNFLIFNEARRALQDLGFKEGKEGIDAIEGFAIEFMNIARIKHYTRLEQFTEEENDKLLKNFKSTYTWSNKISIFLHIHLVEKNEIVDFDKSEQYPEYDAKLDRLLKELRYGYTETEKSDAIARMEFKLEKLCEAVEPIKYNTSKLVQAGENKPLWAHFKILPITEPHLFLKNVGRRLSKIRAKSKLLFWGVITLLFLFAIFFVEYFSCIISIKEMISNWIKAVVKNLQVTF